MEWADRLLKEIPSIGAIVVLVIFFIRHLQVINRTRIKRDEAADLRVHELSESFREAARGCHETQLKSVAAIEKNTDVMGEVQKSIKEMNGLLRTMDGALRQLGRVK